MRKKIKKLHLQKESLLLLSQADAHHVAGGSDANTCGCPLATDSCSCEYNCTAHCTYGGCGQTFPCWSTAC